MNRVKNEKLFINRQGENSVAGDLSLLVRLTRYVLDGTNPSIDNSIDFQMLYNMAKYHGIECIIYKALYELNCNIPTELKERFERDYTLSIMIEALQTTELNLICDELSKVGVDSMPLKGSVLKHMYPSPELRKLGDIDILIKGEHNNVFAIMKNLGYTCRDYADTNEIHFNFYKKPYLCVEMHRSLLPENDRANYLNRVVWEYAIQENNNRFYMRNEFLYVYCMAHFCRHLYNGGAGIKMLIDMFLIKNKSSIDEKLLHELLYKADLTDLDRMVNELIDIWYGEGRVTDNSNIKMLEFLVINSGSYGNETIKTFLRQNENAFNKKKNMMREILPPYSRMKWHYRLLFKYPILLPYYWTKRLANALLFNRSKVVGSLRNNLSTSDADVDIGCLLNAIRS